MEADLHMSRFNVIFVAAVAALLICGMSTPSFAAERAQGEKITQAEKEASNKLMGEAIGHMERAKGALRDGKNDEAKARLEDAFGIMEKAEPIYHGERAKAMAKAKRASKMVERPKAEERAIKVIDEAIEDARRAIETAGDTADEPHHGHGGGEGHHKGPHKGNGGATSSTSTTGSTSSTGSTSAGASVR